MLILRDILGALLLIIAFAALYDHWSQIWPLNDINAGTWPAIGTFAQAFIALLLWKITRRQADISDKQAMIAEGALKESQRATEIAAESVKLDREAMTLAQRPWLKVEIDQTRPNAIRWQGDSMLANFWFKVSNVGHSPAIYATLYYKLEPTPFGGRQDRPYVWHHQRVEKFAETLAPSFDPSYPSYTVFPEDSEIVWQMGGLRDRNDFEIKNVEEYLSQIEAQHTDRFPGFTMIGVIFYQFQPQGERYQTGIIFEISVKDSVFLKKNVENSDFVVQNFFIGRAPVN